MNSHGNPLNSHVRNHSTSSHNAGKAMNKPNGWRENQRPNIENGILNAAARKKTKMLTSSNAKGIGAPPKPLMLTYTHETPTPYMPTPKHQVRNNTGFKGCWLMSNAKAIKLKMLHGQILNGAILNGRIPPATMAIKQAFHVVRLSRWFAKLDNFIKDI